jgi:hypothetical protein
MEQLLTLRTASNLEDQMCSSYKIENKLQMQVTEFRRFVVSFWVLWTVVDEHGESQEW